MKKAPEVFRVKNVPGLESDESFGNNGVFRFPHYRIDGYVIGVVVSDGSGWEHVSVTVFPGPKLIHRPKGATRCPTWEEMCWIKDQFWNEEEAVVQFHPPKSEHVNCHNFCLHLWKRKDINFELPPSIMVGPK